MKIKIIDQTLREGMQYKGIMFSLEQRKNILDFQEALGVDICQAGYPPAHVHEAETVKALYEYGRNKDYNIRVAGMGRTVMEDVKILLNTGIRDFHFHLHIKPGDNPEKCNLVLSHFSGLVGFIRQQKADASISLALLDIGKTDPDFLKKALLFFNENFNEKAPDIISLPDTSGMMPPNQLFDAVYNFAELAFYIRISIHCHNDLGLASANSIMGILAGGRVLEASALGIGERNGIADIYSTAHVLKKQGFDIALRTDKTAVFKDYYKYVDGLVLKQTGEHLMNTNTPVFGDALKTHTAGTHADGSFGLSSEADYDLNVLCGRGLVKKYLNLHNIDCHENFLNDLTQAVKSESIRLNRKLNVNDVQRLAEKYKT